MRTLLWRRRWVAVVIEIGGVVLEYLALALALWAGVDVPLRSPPLRYFRQAVGCGCG